MKSASGRHGREKETSTPGPRFPSRTLGHPPRFLSLRKDRKSRFPVVYRQNAQSGSSGHPPSSTVGSLRRARFAK